MREGGLLQRKVAHLFSFERSIPHRGKEVVPAWIEGRVVSIDEDAETVGASFLDGDFLEIDVRAFLFRHPFLLSATTHLYLRCYVAV